jgi:hypothetical protein
MRPMNNTACHVPVGQEVNKNNEATGTCHNLLKNANDAKKECQKTAETSLKLNLWDEHNFRRSALRM